MRIFWVGSLPGQTIQQRYDLKSLIPSIESGFTLITPNTRLARRIRSAWDALQQSQGKTVWEPLRVYPLESWLLEQWRESVRQGLSADRVILDDQQALTLWQRAIDEEQAASGAYSLLQSGAAAALAHEARERLLRWQVDYGSGSHRQAFELEADCASFLAWSARYQRYLEADHLATAGDCIAGLLEAAAGMTCVPLALIEFEDIPPLLRSCIEALGSPLERVHAEGARARCRALRLPDRRSELATAARWSRDLSEREAGARIGIVLSDMASDRTTMEYLLREAFDCLGKDYTSLPVNFSTGITLDRAPVVRDAMLALGMGLQRVGADTPAALVRSRFLQLPDRHGPATVKLLRQVSDSGKQLLQVSDLRYLASRVKVDGQEGTALGQCLMSMTTQRPLSGSHLPSRWLEPLNALLDTWGWPGQGPLDSLEYQQVKRWSETLEQLASFDPITGPLSLEGILGLLQRLLASRASQPETADSLVQVLGPLEAAGLEFDYLWICGLQASRWPAAARPSPLIPARLQQHLEMPHATAEREWAIADSLMGQYQRGATELIGSYAIQVDGVPELPSALLDGWDTDDAPAVDLVNDDWLAAGQALRVEVCQDSLAPAPEQPELDTLKGGSALLEDQSQCPFRAFARRRLRAEPLGEAVQGMSPADRGSLLHRALQLLFTAIPDSEVLASTSVEGEAAVIRAAVNDALEELPRTGLRAAPAGWRELEGERLTRLLKQWLAIERQREAFRVAATEQDLTVQLQSLRLRLRVDRIDRMADGSTLLLDYKSGTCRIQDWLGDRPARPQLLLYATAEKTPPSALAFAQLRLDNCEFVGAGEQASAPGIRTEISKLVQGGWEIDSWQSLITHWRGRLQVLAGEFLAGEASVEPQPGACTWCGLQSLCRVDQALDV